MLRLGDLVVADWSTFTWVHNGDLVEQVRVHLFNGMTLIMDQDEFMMLVDDEGF